MHLSRPLIEFESVGGASGVPPPIPKPPPWPERQYVVIQRRGQRWNRAALIFHESPLCNQVFLFWKKGEKKKAASALREVIQLEFAS